MMRATMDADTHAEELRPGQVARLSDEQPTYAEIYAMTAAYLRPTPHLVDDGRMYVTARQHAAGAAGVVRVAADPLGVRGLPWTRRELNQVLRALCARLICAEGAWWPGERLARSLRLRGTRAVRLLCAYAHVHHRMRELVGLPGQGYVWGPYCPRATEAASRLAHRMAVDDLFLASLYDGKAPGVAVAQLALQFTGHVDLSEGGDGAAWLALERPSATAVLESVIDAFASTAPGQDALRTVASSRAHVLVSQELLGRLRHRLQDSLADILALGEAG